MPAQQATCWKRFLHSDDLPLPETSPDYPDMQRDLPYRAVEALFRAVG